MQSVSANTNNNIANSFIPEGNREVVITNMLEYRTVIENNNNIIYVPLVAKIVTPLDFMNEDLQFSKISYNQIVKSNGQLQVVAVPNMNLKKLLFAICKTYISLPNLMRYTIIHHISVLRHHIDNHNEHVYLWTYIYEIICKTSLRIIAKELVTMVSVANIHLNLRVKLRNNELISLYI